MNKKNLYTYACNYRALAFISSIYLFYNQYFTLELFVQGDSLRAIVFQRLIVSRDYYYVYMRGRQLPLFMHRCPKASVDLICEVYIFHRKSVRQSL